MNKPPSPSNINLKSQSIERVSSYTYLGLEINDKANFEWTKSNLYKKGLKIYFKLIKTMTPMPKVRTMIHLFDHLIKPVLSYGCEIWGTFSLAFRKLKPTDDPRKCFFLKLKEDHPVVSRLMEKNDQLERLHLKLCKFILGVHGKTTNLGIYGDLGRSPLFIDHITNCLKYFYHLESSDDNKLLKLFYENLKHHEPAVFKDSLAGFAEGVHRLYNKTVTKNCKANIRTIKCLKNHLRQEFLSYWTKSVKTEHSKSTKQGSNKLRTYNLFKLQFKSESYLDIYDRKLLRSLAQFRLGAHRLRIETDRFNKANNYIPPNLRICQMCSTNKMEDELHFLLDCPAYEDLRNEMFVNIQNSNEHFNSYNNVQKLIWLMSSENKQDILTVASFIDRGMSRRGSGGPTNT